MKEVRLSGGGAKSAFWRQLQADIYGVKTATINASEGPAFGVALLAAVGTGTYKNVVEACDATIQVTDSWTPEAKTKKIYDAAYPLYAGLYRSLKGNYAAIAKFVEAQGNSPSCSSARCQRPGLAASTTSMRPVASINSRVETRPGGRR